MSIRYSNGYMATTTTIRFYYLLTAVSWKRLRQLRVGARLVRQLVAPQQQLLTPITAGNSNTYLEFNFNFNLHNKVVWVFVDLE